MSYKITYTESRVAKSTGSINLNYSGIGTEASIDNALKEIARTMQLSPPNLRKGESIIYTIRIEATE